jgi:hypothetical protein
MTTTESVLEKYNEFISYVPKTFDDLINLKQVRLNFSKYLEDIKDFLETRIDLKELMNNAFDVQEEQMEKEMGFQGVGKPSKFKELIAAELGCTLEELTEIATNKYAEKNKVEVEELQPTLDWLKTKY